MSTMRRSEQVLHQLGQQIVHGEIRPGATLPKVETFGEMEGVSRTVVREALKGLEARGLITSLQKVGTKVRPRTDWQWWNVEVMTWAMNAPWSREFFRQLTEVRMAVEPRAAALAARNATSSEVEEIVRRYGEMEKALGDEKAWADADVKFHQGLVRATHNDLMMSLLQIFQNALINSRMATVQVLKQEAMARGQSPSEIILGLHGAVLQGILDHDPDQAQSAMQELLEAVERLVLHVEPDQPGEIPGPS